MPETTPSETHDPVSPSETQEIDETTSMELRILSSTAHLKGSPAGDQRCDGCRYYLEPTAEISYCWHEKLRILVGADWWCQWWDGDDAPGAPGASGASTERVG